MSDQRNGGIVWTEQTWNPLRGCSRVSAGCMNCYAESMAGRFSGEGMPYEGLTTKDSQGRAKWNGKIKLVHDKLMGPIRWQRPRMIFVNSMSDLFHENVPDEFIDQVFAVMALASQHTFQVLTKRPERMRKWFESRRSDGNHLDGFHEWANSMANFISQSDDTNDIYDNLCGAGWPLPNVWIGTTVENQEAADERIPLLLQTPAAVRWVSIEPLLGAVDLKHGEWIPPQGGGSKVNLFKPWEEPLPSLDWIVCGGESGANARPMHPYWVRSLRDQCAEAGVPFLFKQWGEWAPHQARAGGDEGGDLRRGHVRYLQGDGREPDGHFRKGDAAVARIGKKSAGRLLDGALHDGYPLGVKA